jgi:hypothetical protein
VGEQDRAGSYGSCCRARRGTRGRKWRHSASEWGDAVRGRLHQVDRYTFRGIQVGALAAGTERSSKDAGVQLLTGSEVLRVVTRLAASIGVAKSLSASDGLPPLTSSSVEVVSSKLVTLPLGPEGKMRGGRRREGNRPAGSGVPWFYVRGGRMDVRADVCHRARCQQQLRCRARSTSSGPREAQRKG